MQNFHVPGPISGTPPPSLLFVTKNLQDLTNHMYTSSRPHLHPIERNAFSHSPLVLLLLASRLGSLSVLVSFYPQKGRRPVEQLTLWRNLRD
jgi:hypothetical protein